MAHRLTTAARADRILVLDGGRIVEDGTHAELVDAGGTYAALWEAFAAGHEDGERETETAGAPLYRSCRIQGSARRMRIRRADL